MQIGANRVAVPTQTHFREQTMVERFLHLIDLPVAPF